MAVLFQNAFWVFGCFFAVIMLLCGALLISSGLFALQRHRAVDGWPQAPAVVETSEVAAERHFENDLMYRPVIRYRYSAPGGSFVGDKLATTSRLYAKEAAARRVTARYPRGNTVMARYNPADPAEAVLERGISGGIWFLLFGLLCWIVPVALGLAAGFPVKIMVALPGILILLPTVFMVRSRSRPAQARLRGLYPAAGSGTDEDVKALMARGEKLLAIKLYRELHGGGLKDAKQAVETMSGDSLS